MSLVYEELRQAGDLCDAVLKVQDTEFQVHKIILSISSSYFRDLFVLRSSPNQVVYEITDITPAIMELIIKFVYTGSVPVTMVNVQDLMLTADHIGLTDLVQKCSRFLEEHLCPENCLSIWQFTRAGFPELHFKAWRYVLDHFQEVVCGQELLQLTVEDLAHFLDRDDLIVSTESSVYEGMVRWIVQDPDGRKGHLCKLMSKIRLCLMNAEYIRINVLSNHLVKNDSECLKMVTKASRIAHYLLDGNVSSVFSNAFVRPRMPSAVLFGTGDRCPEVYDIRVNQWVKLTSRLAELPTDHGVAFLNGNIYFIGGFSGKHLNTVHRFDPVTKNVQEVAPMHFVRSQASVTVLNGLIYALGGHDLYTHHRSAECFQHQTNQWSLIAPMQEKRSEASCTVLRENIYIFGGHNGISCLDSAEYYNPQTNQWTMIPNMNSPRGGVAAVAYGNCAYVVGGFDGFNANTLSSAEVYDPLTRSWTALPPMKTPRRSPGIGVLEDRIIVVGGHRRYVATETVESFDPTRNLWSQARSTTHAHHHLACCVVYGLPNMEEYTFNRDYLPQINLSEKEEEA